MAYPAALHVPPDYACASSSDGGASSVDPGEEAIDIARARAGDRRAIARVAPRIIRRTFFGCRGAVAVLLLQLS